jgi:DnaJ-domain-containing protein 1
MMMYGAREGPAPHARMNRQLTDHPLADLIYEISEARLSGALRLTREHARAAVYFDGGHTVAALSNLRALRLVEVLRRSHAVEEARLSALVREGMSDEQVGLLLLRVNLLDEAALKVIQERRSKEVLRELLRWTEGEWSFDARVRLAGLQQGGHVDASGFLVEAARNLPTDFITSRVNDDEILAPSVDAQRKIEEGGVRLLPAEAFVLSRVYEPLRLSEVVTLSGLPEEETRRAVYMLALGGLIERKGRTQALPDEVLRQVAASRTAPATNSKAAPKSTSKTVEREQTTTEPETPATVEELLARARGTTHYEVLGVVRSASTEQIKRAYYSHARRLHPDRFSRDANEELRQQIDSAFARIAQAYETLKDSSMRAAYDLKLSKKRNG